MNRESSIAKAVKRATSKIPAGKEGINKMLIAIISASIGGLTSWALKMEDRVFNLAAKSASRYDIEVTEKRLEQRLEELQEVMREMKSKLEKKIDK